MSRGREWYREYKESEYDPILESRQEDDGDYSGDCKNCKWDSVCEGGCKINPKLEHKFERKEVES